MAKIDVTKIQGYEAMSAEEKLAALEAYEFDDKTAEIERYKTAASKANSEAADWKKKHNALLSEDDKKRTEEAEKWAAMQTELEELRKERNIAKHTASFAELGYNAELAAQAAQALVDSDTEKLFELQKKFIALHDQERIANGMKNMPKPPAGTPGGEAMTIDKLRALSTEERAAFYREHPDEYRTLYGG